MTQTTTRLTPTLAELAGVPDERRERAGHAAYVLAAELAESRSELDEHEFRLKHDLGAVEVRRGPLTIARIVFNFADSGRARVFSEVLGEPGSWSRSQDFDDENEAISSFKKILYEGTKAFYRRKDEFRGLGLI